MFALLSFILAVLPAPDDGSGSILITQTPVLMMIAKQI
jgi:hypothetical protein